MVLVALLCVVTGDVAAQEVQSEALQELRIEARKVEFDQASRQLQFTGAVQLRKGDMELRCDRVTAYVDDQGQLVRLAAAGHIWLRALGVIVRAARLSYDMAHERVTLNGGARLEQRGSELHGQQVVIDLARQKVVLQEVHGVFRQW
jgi:lipopolysaccharide transport protein LptA